MGRISMRRYVDIFFPGRRFEHSTIRYRNFHVEKLSFPLFDIEILDVKIFDPGMLKPAFSLRGAPASIIHFDFDSGSYFRPFSGSLAAARPDSEGVTRAPLARVVFLTPRGHNRRSEGCGLGAQKIVVLKLRVGTDFRCPLTSEGANLSERPNGSLHCQAPSLAEP